MGCHAVWRTGLALSLTVAVSYLVRAILYRLWPEQGIAFLNALFHGLDSHKLVVPAPFSVGMLVYPLLVLMVRGGLGGACVPACSNCCRARGGDPWQR